MYTAGGVWAIHSFGRPLCRRGAAGWGKRREKATRFSLLLLPPSKRSLAPSRGMEGRARGRQRSIFRLDLVVCVVGRAARDEARKKSLQYQLVVENPRRRARRSLFDRAFDLEIAIRDLGRSSRRVFLVHCQCSLQDYLASLNMKSHDRVGSKDPPHEETAQTRNGNAAAVGDRTCSRNSTPDQRLAFKLKRDQEQCASSSTKDSDDGSEHVNTTQSPSIRLRKDIWREEGEVSKSKQNDTTRTVEICSAKDRLSSNQPPLQPCHETKTKPVYSTRNVEACGAEDRLPPVQVGEKSTTDKVSSENVLPCSPSSLPDLEASMSLQRSSNQTRPGAFAMGGIDNAINATEQTEETPSAPEEEAIVATLVIDDPQPPEEPMQVIQAVAHGDTLFEHIRRDRKARSIALTVIFVLVAVTALAVGIGVSQGSNSDNGEKAGSGNDVTSPSIPSPRSLTVPPTAEPTARPSCRPLIELSRKDGAAGDRFGWNLDISGNTIAVGAYRDDDNGDNSGSVYVFSHSAEDGAGSWSHVDKVLASDGMDNDRFGFDVAISDGILVVGSRSTEKGDNSGSAYIFTQDEIGVWREVSKVFASNGTTADQFGRNIAVDGNFVVVGAWGDDNGNGDSSGSSYVYKRQLEGIWEEEAKIFPSSSAAGDYFGVSVGISDETGTIVAGAWGDDGRGIDSGSATIFSRSEDGTWQEEMMLYASDGKAGDEFGFSCAIFGNTAVIGAPNNRDRGVNAGAAYVFSRNTNGSWQEKAKLLAPDGAVRDRFGLSVNIHGKNILIGAPGRARAYLFSQIEGNWTNVRKLQATDGAALLFGWSVAISEQTLVVGDYKFWPYGQDDVENIGSAFVSDYCGEGS